MTETLHDAAVAFTKAGFAVFPLAVHEKIPACAGGFTVATTDTARIDELWTARPEQNIGVATGEASGGLVVIDIDCHENGVDGMDALKDWEAVHGELPETASSITGSGGYHLWYYCDEKFGISTNVDDGIDIKCDGGYVVAPPSIHPNGRSYQWENHPDDVPIAKADDNVKSFIRKIQGKDEPSVIKKRFKLPEVIKQGERDDVMMRYASSMQAIGTDDDTIMASLEAANRLRCQPPLTDKQLEKIFKSITERYEKGSKRAFSRVCVPLMLNERGKPQQTIENCMRILSNDPVLAGRFTYNVMAYTKYVQCPVPWDVSTELRPITDIDYASFTAFLERNYGITHKEKAIDALNVVSYANKCNPVRDWLDSLKWDGEERAGFLLSTFLGADPNDYNHEVMELFMMGAVTRAYEPGAKFDYMPVLIGEQGIGKSYFVSMLGTKTQWSCDNFNTIEGDGAAEKLRGVWIAEMAELLATRKARDIESIKSFITSRVDTIRPKYCRETEQRPRVCVFIGTTNEPMFLSDKTGNRRFLPIECGKHDAAMSMFDDGAKPYFEQAWAEVVAKYKASHPALVLSTDATRLAIAEQEKCTEDDERIGIIQARLDDKLMDCEAAGYPAGDIHWRVCVSEISSWLDDYKVRIMPKVLTNDIHSIMRNSINGWVREQKKQRTLDYGVQVVYVPEKRP